MPHMLIRRDDNGAAYLITDNMEPDAAALAQSEMTRRGHKQDYDVLIYERGRRAEVMKKNGIRE